MRWLLERFGVDEALIGDIAEERRAGRSAWWLGRQVSVAIVRTTLRAWRLHPWLALRAIAVGWLCLFLVEGAYLVLLSVIKSSIAIYILLATSNFVSPFCSAWLVARLHRPQQAAMAMCFSLSLAVPLEVLVLWLWDKPLYVVFHWEMVYRTAVIVFAALAGSLLPRRRMATKGAA